MINNMLGTNNNKKIPPFICPIIVILIYLVTPSILGRGDIICFGGFFPIDDEPNSYFKKCVIPPVAQFIYCK